MATKVKQVASSGSEGKTAYTIIELNGNPRESESLNSSTDRRLTIDHLPQFLRDHSHVLEGMDFYQKHGYLWFYLRDAGTKLRGPLKINYDGETEANGFRNVTEKQFNDLPFSQRAFGHPGRNDLLVLFANQNYYSVRVSIYGIAVPIISDNVVILQRNSGEQSKPSNGNGHTSISVPVVNEVGNQVKQARRD